jgi:mono/diheme cytochrome c family protein
MKLFTRMKLLTRFGTFPRSGFRAVAISGLLIGLALVTVSCRLDMREQPRLDPLEQSSFFADKLSARPRVADTVARGQLHLDEQLYTGRINDELATTFPFTITQATIERGQERFDIFCAPCHGLLGDGQGIITEYGMRVPPSFHDPALRDEPAGYYFEVMTDGTRVMPSYGERIVPQDRWAIVAYIRALQLSQNAELSQVPADQVPKLGQTDTITK